MNTLPPPRLSGLAWRNMSKGAYAGQEAPLERLEADLASDYDLVGSEARGVVWEAAAGVEPRPSQHSIILRYEAEAAKLKPGVRRSAGYPSTGFRADRSLSDGGRR